MLQWAANERLYLVASAAALLAAVGRLVGAPRAAVRVIAVAALGFFVAHAAAVAAGWDGQSYRDFLCFWQAGRNLLGGIDPYAAAFPSDGGTPASGPFLNPPTALPLFAAFGLAPLTTAYAGWTAANAVLAAALVPLARRALAADGSPAAAGLDGPTALALGAAVCLSNADRANLLNGQLGGLAAVALTATYLGVARERPAGAAAMMTVATAKAGTALPFLLLFARRPARAGVLWLAGIVAGVCLLTAGPAEQAGRLRLIAGAIGRFGGEGQLNDYSRAGPHPADILGFDRVYYHLGVRDRGHVRVATALTLAVLGAGVGVLAVRPGTPRGLVPALLACYALLFLYHRSYDALVLALPIAYAAGHARTARGPARWWMLAAAVALLLVLYMPRKALFQLMHRPFESPAVGAVVEHLVLPLPTWLVVLGMGCLWAGGRALPPAPPPDPAG